MRQAASERLKWYNSVMVGDLNVPEIDGRMGYCSRGVCG